MPNMSQVGIPIDKMTLKYTTILCWYKQLTHQTCNAVKNRQLNILNEMKRLLLFRE